MASSCGARRLHGITRAFFAAHQVKADQSAVETVEVMQEHTVETIRATYSVTDAAAQVGCWAAERDGGGLGGSLGMNMCVTDNGSGGIITDGYACCWWWYTTIQACPPQRLESRSPPANAQPLCPASVRRGNQC
jgi:hypothetical protein